MVINARRYECQRCFAILTVVPSETAPRRHYSACAIAFALGLYGLCNQTQAEVRAQVCSAQVVGAPDERRWITLPRWIDAASERRLFPSVPTIPSDQGRRAIAERAAMAIGANAPPTQQAGAPAARAFFGAAHMK